MNTESRINTRMAAVIIVFVLCASCRAEGPLKYPSDNVVHNPQFAISRNAVWQAIANFLEQRGVSRTAPPSDMRLPSGLMSRQKSPELEISGVTLNPFSRKLQIHVRCHAPADCGNFLALLPAPATFQNASLLQKKEQRRSALLKANSGPKLAPKLVRPGSAAVLTLESKNIRLKVPVVCLEAGALAQQIRVRDPETQKILQATVVGPARLQATF